MELQHHSFLTPYGYQPGSCGYCKDENSSQRTPSSRGSYYANSTRLTVDHYQDLVDRGWRRSGTTVYKPDLQRSCCPHYTIRLPVADFKPSRHQRKCANQWTRHVLGPDFEKEAAKLRPPKSREEKRAGRNGEFDLQAAIHAPEYDRLAEPAPQPKHRYTVTLEPDSYTDEKYALFEQYQRLVHHEPSSQISKTGFRRFLCDSPLVRTTRTIAGTTQELGSYHQLHRLDGKLIALSVLDLLPHAVSAVYFIYLATPFTSPQPVTAITTDEPPSEEQTTDFAAFSPGKLSALREAALAAERGLDFYYMGFYIHSCTKMRYKAEFRPQQVLDPASHGWDAFDGPDGVGVALDESPFVSMSRRRAGGDDDEQHGAIAFPRPTEAAEEARSLFELRMPGVMPLTQLLTQVDLGAVLAEVKHQPQPVVVPISFLRSWQEMDAEDGTTLKGAIAEMAAAVGPDVARKMVVKFG